MSYIVNKKSNRNKKGCESRAKKYATAKQTPQDIKPHPPGWVKIFTSIIQTQKVNLPISQAQNDIPFKSKYAYFLRAISKLDPNPELS